MKLDEFRRTIEQAAPLAEKICLHLMGEPLAHPNFDEILKICEDNNAEIILTTNGLLLKRYQETILASKCVYQVNVSVQSYMDNYPNQPIEKYLDKISNFLINAMERRPEMYLNLRLWNIENQNQEMNEPIFQYMEKLLNLTINRKLELGRIKSKKLVNRLYLHFDSRFEWPRMEQEFQSKQGRCNGMIDHFAIHASGNVSPCCLDDQNIINLGNVFKTNLPEILNSPRATAMATGFKNNQLIEELCQKCDYIRRFRK